MMPSDNKELRNKLRDLVKPDKFDPRYPIEAYEDDLVALIADQCRLARLSEVKAIAPDMRHHPEYKGYVETSISGKWQPLADRIKTLENKND
jgi:hypothetical protein